MNLVLATPWMDLDAFRQKRASRNQSSESE